MFAMLNAEDKKIWKASMEGLAVLTQGPGEPERTVDRGPALHHRARDLAQAQV
jgi:hypothetical protein